MSLPIPELSHTLARTVQTVGASVFRLHGPHHHSATAVAIAAHRLVTSASAVRGESVTLSQGETTFTGVVKARDLALDLAFIDTEQTLTPATFATSAPPPVGTLVLQLARPGLTVRATSGIVMAANERPFESARGGELSSYLETDAAFERGFVGGPLVSLTGEVLGLASLAIVRGRSAISPSATVLAAAEQIERHGKLQKSWLGLEMQPVRLPDDVQKTTGEEVGLLVLRVAENGPAATAGLKYGDTVLHLGDDTVRTIDDVTRYLRANRVGQQVPVSVFREGQVQKLAVTVGARP